MKLSENKSGGDFTPHPESEGTINAVLVDITPLKEVPDKFHPGQTKEVFRLVYETEVMDEDNDRRYCIWSRPYTPSLNEKANFRKDIKKILGRDLTEMERNEFDTESLIGKNVKLIVQHEEGQNGQTYAVISFLGANKDGKLKPSGKYTRVQDRPKDGQEAPAKTEPKGKAKAASWEDVIVHMGKHKGKRLGDVDEAGVQALIDKWLPDNGTVEPLASALREVQALLTTAEDY